MDDRYPHEPGYKGSIDTGRNAALGYAGKAKPVRRRFLEHVRDHGPATSEEVSEAIGVHWMIGRARGSELHKQGLIEDSGERGAGALGGKVVVWRITEAGRAA